MRHFLEIPGVCLPLRVDPAHLFAWGYQIRRAFEGTFRGIHGGSGTGKELVARAVGHARYIPFDPTSQCFREDFASSFHAVSLSALSATLIESELFGHKRGVFTGALQDRTGWLEACSELGTVFLDEIGELDPQIQVKLLRHYCTQVYAQTGSYEEAGRRLGLDRRTVKARLDPALLERLRSRPRRSSIGRNAPAFVTAENNLLAVTAGSGLLPPRSRHRLRPPVRAR